MVALHDDSDSLRNRNKTGRISLAASTPDKIQTTLCNIFVSFRYSGCKSYIVNRNTEIHSYTNQMARSATYRMFVQATALLLLIGVALPTGLHAKALVDFCMEPVQVETGMLPDHSCCPSDSEHEANSDAPEAMDHPESHEKPATHNGCEAAVICACHIDRAPLNDQNWTAQNHPFAGIIADIATVIPETHTDRHAVPAPVTDIYSSPPIFLLNSTFLN